MTAASVVSLPVPAVVVDGDVDVCCENFLAQPNEGCGLTVAVLNGTLRTDLLRWRNGDMLIAGGVMTARSISTFNPITVTCRDGVLLLDWPSDYEMTFVLSGGEAYLAGPLNEGTVVEAGAGILAAQDVSAAEIHGDGASVLGGEDAESWYCQTTYSEDWSGAQDGMTWDALTLADAGGGWFAGTLSLEDAAADELLPWGALWLRLAGENTVSGEVGGTGLLVEGDGSKRLPLKAHAYYEPVIPPENDRTLLVAGALGIGGTIENNVHRPELFCSLCDALISDEATPERIARVINHEALSNEVIINQCDNAELRAGAGRLAQRLRATVYIACLKEGLLCSF